MNNIDWKKLWHDYNIWWEKQCQPKTCRSCKKKDFNEPEWDEQQNKIARLVNAQVRKILKMKDREFTCLSHCG